jgi:hypothetical protein
MPEATQVKNRSPQTRHEKTSVPFRLFILQEFAGSRLTAVDFCSQKNISPSTFYQWRKRLTKSPTSNYSIPKGSFIPVTLASPEEVLCQKSSDSPSDFMLHFNESLSLSICQGFHSPTLKRIVQTLSA